MYALNATSGNHIWNYTTGIYAPTHQTPAVAYGIVYIGTSGKMYALNATDGSKIWSRSIGSGRVAVADEVVYVGDGYALNAFTGDIIWSYEHGFGSPAVADGVLYGYSGRTIYAFGVSNDVAVTNVTSSKTIVGQGYTVPINVTVENQGDFTETFNVTLYANATIIQTLNVPTIINGDMEDNSSSAWVYSEIDAGEASGRGYSGDYYSADSTYISSGNYSYRIGYSGNGVAGDYGQIKQTVTAPADVSNIHLDAYVNYWRYAACTYQNYVKYYIYIDSNKVYELDSTCKGGSNGYTGFIHHQIDISSYLTPNTDFDIIFKTYNIQGTGGWTAVQFIDDVKLTRRIPKTTSTVITFTWNTTGFAYGNYTISAYADPVPGETDTADNTYTDGTVLVTIPGDVNGDRIVDIFDIGTISAHWYPGPPIGPLGYHPNADINDDGAVDIFDVGIASAHWGQSW